MGLSNIHENLHSPAVLPPPWYLPPPNVTKGPKRARACIIGGLLVDHDEGHRWFKAFYDYDLPNHHRQDLNIPIRLEELFLQQGIAALGCSFAPRRLESQFSDFLVITQVIRGPFVHDGLEMYEVYDVERQPIEGVKETQVKEHLKKNFGLNTSGFKSYYSNLYRF